MASDQLQEIVQMLRAYPVAGEDRTIAQMRAAMDAAGDLFPPADDVRREVVCAGDVLAQWFAAPSVDDGRVILYLHGGGWILGSPHSCAGLAARLSRAAGARALALDYRLAPEHPFPAGLDDCVAGYRWLLASGYDPRRIVIAGDSAGGNLTLATLVLLRYYGVPLPAAAVCLSPVADLSYTRATWFTRADTDAMLNRAASTPRSRARSRDWYLGDVDPSTPLASPVNADLRGLPPLLIQVGSNEPLLDDAIAIADRARAAGVSVTLEVWDEMFHVWQSFAAILPEGQEAIDRIGAFIRSHVGDRPAPPPPSSAASGSQPG